MVKSGSPVLKESCHILYIVLHRTSVILILSLHNFVKKIEKSLKKVKALLSPFTCGIDWLGETGFQ